MTTSNHPLTMFNYHAWATQTILNRLQELPSDVLHQEVNSSFPTIAHALSHIYAVDKMWYMVLTGKGMPEAFQDCMALNTSIRSSVDDYANDFKLLSGQISTWIGSQSNLEQTLLLDNPFAGVRETRLSEVILQMTNHGTYHRGNVSTMLRQLGHASVMQDYALFWYQDAH